jgi:hypothetical protein
MTSEALASSPARLWRYEVGSLTFVGGGIIMLVDDPRQWLAAVSGIIFFGLAAAVFGWQLVLRRGSRAVDGR